MPFKYLNTCLIVKKWVSLGLETNLVNLIITK